MRDITTTLRQMANDSDSKIVTSDEEFEAKLEEKCIKIAERIKLLGFDEKNHKNFTIIVRYLARMVLKQAAKGLLITGDTGTGKTFAMMMIAERSKIRRRNAGYVSAQEFANKVCEIGSYKAIKEYVNDLKAEAWRDGRWDMKSYEHVDLIIDDLGSEVVATHYGKKTESLVELISERYDLWRKTGARTHFTTNLTTDQIEERYGKRIASRIFEMCFIVKFEGEDRRRDR